MKVTITKEHVIIDFDNKPDLADLKIMELHKELEAKDYKLAKEVMADTRKTPIVYKPRQTINKKKWTKWSNKEINDIKNMAKNGYNTISIARYIKRTEFAVSKKLSSLGISLRKEREKNIIKEKRKFFGRKVNKPIIQKTWQKGEDDTLLNLIDRGYNYTQIAKMMNRTPSSIYMRHGRLKKKGMGMKNWKR